MQMNMTTKDLPKYLYKFKSLKNVDHVESLLRGKLYFSSPLELNDPFDCNITIRYDYCDDDLLTKIIRHDTQYSEPDLSDKQVREIITNFRNERDIPKKFYNFMNQNFGIFSMSEEIKSPLLWAHYADSWGGIAIEYDYAKLFSYMLKSLKQEGLKVTFDKVKYKRKFPQLIPKSPNNNKLILRSLLIKPLEWNYEKEWRIILTKLQFKSEYQIPKDIINALYLGPRCERESEVREILKSIFPHYKVY